MENAEKYTDIKMKKTKLAPETTDTLLCERRDKQSA
jgi:hypothetical protein